MSSEPTHEELRATLQLAQMFLGFSGPEQNPTVMRLARALVRFGEAVAHYERCITWDTSCQRCGRLLDAAHAADRRADEAESALAVAVARRGAPSGVLTLLNLPPTASDQDTVDALMSVVAEAGLWRMMKEQGRTPPDPIPPGTTIADLLRLPDDEHPMGGDEGSGPTCADPAIVGDAFAQTVDRMKRDGDL